MFKDKSVRTQNNKYWK